MGSCGRAARAHHTTPCIDTSYGMIYLVNGAVKYSMVCTYDTYYGNYIGSWYLHHRKTFSSMILRFVVTCRTLEMAGAFGALLPCARLLRKKRKHGCDRVRLLRNKR